LGVLAFAMAAPGDAAPNDAAFAEAYSSREGQAALQARVTLLHCTSLYPAPAETVNLRAMDTLRAAFDLPVGYSDHTLGITVALAAVARGAVMIEKHFTLDRAQPGPDHQASLEPEELRRMIAGIREIEEALGSVHKGPTPAEHATRAVARKCLVASRPIRRGERFTAANIDAKRAATGVAAMRYWEALERTADRDYVADEPIML
jgi:N-acetylneuraminate synthase